MSFRPPQNETAVAEVFGENFKPDPAPISIDPASLPKVSGDDRAKRCGLYIDKMPPAISENGGHNQMFNAACETYRFAVSDSDRLAILARYNARCEPPFSEPELRHKIESAEAETREQVGMRLIHKPDAVSHGRNMASRIMSNTDTDADAPPVDRVRNFVMRSGSSIDDDGIKYLVKRRWIMGALNIMFSRPGRGKSTIAASVAGFVTTGRSWPDQTPVPQGAVLYLKGEGSDASIRDRLKLAGADLDKVFIVGRADTADDDESPMIDLANDHAALMRAVQDCEDQCGEAVRLIIVDTLDSMFPSMRMIDNANIRKCLWPLQELAEQTGICALILAHTNKGGYQDPLDRLSGGRAIGGAARSVWYLGKLDPEADDCYLASVKANDYLPAPTMGYQIVGINPDSPGSIRWGDVAEDVSAWDLDLPPKVDKGAKAEECVEWMGGLLAHGPVLLGDMNREAAKFDYGDRVVKKAKTMLGTTSVPQKGTFPPVYWLCLDGQAPPEVEAKV